MSHKSRKLADSLRQHFGGRLLSINEALAEVGIEVASNDYLELLGELRESEQFDYAQLIDLCGVDYATHGDNLTGKRFAVVVHLLSITHNQRLRVRTFANDDDFPSVDSATQIWASADWYEREAFDLFGIVFPGHNDLRRILTDYGFSGHPFRKDFPISGHVEVRYDPEAGRVIYQPVSIEPREVTPRIIRQPGFGNSGE